MCTSKEKRTLQLGMNPSTAQHRLVKDLLWNFIETTGKNQCCKCNKPMSRDTFSIEHVIPWMDSENPLELFFDIKNIGYSPLSCNAADSRGNKKYHTAEALSDAKKRWCRENKQRHYTTEKRQAQYQRTGK